MLAHGPQLQITNVAGKIVTRQVFVEQPYNQFLTDVKSAYVIPVESSPAGGGTEWFVWPNNIINGATGGPLYVSGPGIAYGFGWTFDPLFMTFPAGSNFRIEFVDGLKKWNGASLWMPAMRSLRCSAFSQLAGLLKIAGGYPELRTPAPTRSGIQK